MGRQCPNCLAKIPAHKVLAYSNNITCPSCKSLLELSAFGRTISAFGALIIGAIVFKISFAYYAQQQHPAALAWVFPVLFAYLAYSIAAPVILIFVADLRLRPFEPEPIAHEPASAHHPSH